MTDGGDSNIGLYVLGKSTLLLHDETEGSDRLDSPAILSKPMMETATGFIHNYKKYAHPQDKGPSLPNGTIFDANEKCGTKL